MNPTFLERQGQLCSLSSFISEQKQWLQNWLNVLGWTVEGLQSSTELFRCPFNPHHFVPKASLEDHKKKCQYAVLLDTNMHELDDEELASMNVDTMFLYKDSSSFVESTKIGQSVVNAVKKLAADLPEVCVSRNSHVMGEQFSSLEDNRPSPQGTNLQTPSELISYIKAWRLVPSDFAFVDGSSLNLGKVKGWLFNHLPTKHAHSSALGGEITMVDTIMACLAPPKARRTNITPNMLMNRLQPLLGLNARSLVLDLWKYFHISRIQKEYGLMDSFVSEILPMSASMLEGMQEVKREDTTPSVAKLIEGIIESANTPPDNDKPLPLQLDHVTRHMTTSERRILYDYIVEVTSHQALMKLDPDLYRDDMAVIKAKLKAQGKLEAASAKNKDVEKEEIDIKGKTYLQLLKEKRDYKRRRQKYRAKNVHITRRTPTEIFRTIINNRMEELRAEQDDVEKDVEKDTVPPASKKVCDSEHSEERPGASRNEGEHERDDLYHRHESSRSRRRHRSRSRRRDERRDHKKQHKNRSRERGRSRERDKSRERDRYRERSRSRERRYRERERSRERLRRSERERSREKARHKHRTRSRSKS